MSKDKERKASSPWEVDVDVYVHPESHVPPFEIESYLQEHESGNLVFRNRGRHGFFVSFHLHDLTGEGYRWPSPSDVDEALRSREGEGCAEDGCGQWREFKARRITNNREILVVRNLNEKETKFCYTLRVTKDNGDTYRDLDPGGDNLNGNFTRFIE